MALLLASPSVTVTIEAKRDALGVSSLYVGALSPSDSVLAPSIYPLGGSVGYELHQLLKAEAATASVFAGKTTAADRRIVAGERSGGGRLRCVRRQWR